MFLPPQIHLKDSISFRLLLAVFSIYCVVSIAVTGFHLVVEYSDAKTRVVEEMKGLVQMFEQGISNAIWNGDIEQLESIVTGISGSPNVVGASIRIPLLNQSISHGAFPEQSEVPSDTSKGTPTPSKYDLGSQYIQYQTPITHIESEEGPIGSLTLFSSEEIIFNQVKGSFVIIIINAMIKTLALWIIFLWVSRILLGRPLLTLTTATHNMDLDNLGDFKINIKTKGRNEFKLLEESFNTMIQKIYKSQLELRQQKEQLAEQVELRSSELQKTNRQMQEDLTLAAELQHSVLSDIPDLPFLKTSYRYFSYDRVSGDVYDMLINRENAFCFFLGDATGHGVAAAFMTMMVEIGLDSIPHHLTSDEVLRRLNHLLASRDTGKSITGIYLRISEEGNLRASNAGHPPLIVIPGNDSELVSLDEAGCPLGMFVEEIVPFVEEQHQLQEGDKVFVYTDGVTEWENTENEQFGSQRLIHFLTKNRSLEINMLLENLTLHLEEFSQGNPCNDDVTFHCFEFRKP